MSTEVSTRLCPYCNEDKPYDPRPLLRNNKMSGFYGVKCWDCFRASHRKDAPEELRRPPPKAKAEPEYSVEDGRPFRPKHCASCRQMLPHFFEEPTSRKVSGFHGSQCWDCYRMYMRMYAWHQRPQDPTFLALLRKELDEKLERRAELKRQREEAQRKNSSPLPPLRLPDEMLEVLYPKK